jgi:hypothetical protein
MSAAGDAMKKLNAAGKRREAREVVQREADRASGAYRFIRQDASLSEEGKRQQLAVEALRTRRKVEQELTSMARLVLSSDREDVAKVLGTAGVQGDPASLIISRRDASDRVANVTDRAELQELLRQATRSGDELLARAVAAKALDNLDDSTMNLFLEDRPHLDAAANRLWNAQRAETDTLGDVAVLADLSPHELIGMDEDGLSEVASTTVAEAENPWPSWSGGAA